MKGKAINVDPEHGEAEKSRVNKPEKANSEDPTSKSQAKRLEGQREDSQTKRSAEKDWKNFSR